jgi:FtsP/CotA-like multicopper oxidase with cupredoxin domain
MTDSRSTVEPTTDQFPTDPSGLPEARQPEVIELSDGDELDLRIAPVAKKLGDATVRMLAYNGSIPGPILKVPQDSEVVVNVENQGDLEATVHWHGLRLRNRYDGTPETQRPIPVCHIAEHHESGVMFSFIVEP